MELQEFFPEEIIRKIAKCFFDEEPQNPWLFQEFKKRFGFSFVPPMRRPEFLPPYFTLSLLQKQVCKSLWAQMFEKPNRPVLLMGLQYHGFTTALLTFAHLVRKNTGQKVIYFTFSQRHVAKAKERFEELFEKERASDLFFESLPANFRGLSANVIIIDHYAPILPEWVDLSNIFFIFYYPCFTCSRGPMTPLDTQTLPPKEKIKDFQTIIINK